MDTKQLFYPGFTNITNWKYFQDMVPFENAKKASKDLAIDVRKNGTEELKIIKYSLEGMYFFNLVRVENNVAWYEYNGSGA